MTDDEVCVLVDVEGFSFKPDPVYIVGGGRPLHWFKISRSGCNASNSRLDMVVWVWVVGYRLMTKSVVGFGWSDFCRFTRYAPC